MSSSQASKLSGLKPPSKLPKSGASGGRGLGSASSSRAQSPEPQQPAALPAAVVADRAEQAIDDFIIGQRVYVGGVKPGVIAFLGEAQFAPGQWAGVILDDTSGKNDGSVQGKRYFQCEPGRGIFSRPAKLTRHPTPAPSLVASDATSASSTAAVASEAGTVSVENLTQLVPTAAPIVAAGQATSQASGTTAVAASAKGRGLPSKNGTLGSSTSSLSGTSAGPDGVFAVPAAVPPQSTPNGAQSLKVGDRVLVNGLKPGTLRYVGTTEFAPGDWAGVELDEPQGKNDGSVAGKRYFSCAPLHGLFAPAHKVSRDGEGVSSQLAGAATSAASPRLTTPVRPPMPAGSAAQPASGRQSSLAALAHTPASTKMRSMSRESLTSVGSAASSSVSRSRAPVTKSSVTGTTSRKTSASTAASGAMASATTVALQKALKEKDEHIEQLLRERDLERSDVARAAVQIDETRSVYQSRLTEVESQLAVSRAESEKLQYEMKETVQLLNEKVTELEMERNNALLQVDEFRRKIEDLQFQIEEDAISKNDLESKQDQLQLECADREQHREAKDEEEEMLKALRHEVEREKSARLLLIDELHSIKDQLLAERQKVIASEQSAITYLEQIEELTDKLSGEERKVAAVKDQQQQQIESLQLEMKKFLADKEAEAKCSAVSASDSAAAMKHKESVIAGLEETIRDLKTLVSSMQFQEATLKEKVQELQGQLGSRTCELDDLHRVAQKSKGDMQDLARQLAASETKCTSLSDDKSKLEISVSEILKNSGDSSKQLSLMNDQLLEKDRQLAELHDHLRSNERRIAEAADDIVRVTEQFSRERDVAASQHSSQLKDLSDKLFRVQSDLDAAYKNTNETKERHSAELSSAESSWEKRLEEVRRDHAAQLVESAAAVTALEERCKTLQRSAEEKAAAVAEEREQLRFKLAELTSQLEGERAAAAERTAAERCALQEAREAREHLEFELAEVRATLEADRAVAVEQRKSAEDFRRSASEARERLEFELAEVRTLLETERSALGDERAKAERDHRTATDSRERLEFELAELRAAADGERAELAGRCARLEADLRSAVDARERLEFEVVEARSQLEAERAALIKRLQDAEAAAANGGDAAAAARASLEVERAELMSRIERLVADARASAETRERLEFEAAEARAQLEAERAVARRRLEEESARSDSLERAASETRERLEFEAAEARAQLEAECSSLRSSLEEVRSRLEAELRSAVDARDRLEFEIVEARAQLDADRAELARRLQEAAGSTGEQEEELRKVRGELDTTRTMSADLGKQLEAARMRIEEMQRRGELELAELREQLEAAKRASAETREQRDFDVAELRAQIDAARLSALDLRGQLDASRAAFADAKEQHEFEVTELRDQLETARAVALTDAAGKERLLLNDVERLKGEISSVQDTVRKLEAEKATLSNDCETMTFEKEEFELKYSEKCKEASVISDALNSYKLDSARLSEENTKLSEELKQSAGKLEKLATEKMLSDALLKENQVKIEMLHHQLEEVQAGLQTDKTNRDEIMRMSSAKELDDLNQQLQMSARTLETVQEQLRQALVEQESLAQQLAASHASGSDRSVKLESDCNRLALENAELLSRIKVAEQQHSSDRIRLAGDIETSKRAAQAFESQLHSVRAENQQLANQKAAAESLEKDKRRLEAEIAELRRKTPASAAAVHAAGDAVNQDSNIDLMSQVDFLNSVIVDLQKKNEELKRQVEVLTIGDNGHVEDDSSFFEAPRPGVRPPRLFCDICDVFDAHDTDDCPRQASSDSPPPSHHGGSRNAPDRPYCDVCEAFGHWTEHCDDEQTF